MFYLARRVLTGVPFASAAIGLAGQPLALAVPPAAVTIYVLLRDRFIRRKIGTAAWPSDGFACHVLVDDLCWLLCLTVLGLPLFLLGGALRSTLLG